ncbi:hypothetical protein AVEN_89491-1 [Araneus ventricosus]|uniref:Uncharacterized protein n=1 Tax=Araneus ventricosus TaxID=182803 RepID=A0A4Y2P9E8_ARAVE|nr:hypothetical protein AVEN_89491-1 [Araneus ventricosus]
MRRGEIYGLIHHPWLNHNQRLNDGSAIIMRKLTKMRRQMHTLAGCYFGMVSQFFCCCRFLELPSAFEPNEFLANSPVQGMHPADHFGQHSLVRVNSLLTVDHRLTMDGE